MGRVGKFLELATFAVERTDAEKGFAVLARKTGNCIRNLINLISGRQTCAYHLSQYSPTRGPCVNTPLLNENLWRCGR